MLIVDSQGNIIVANPPVEAMFGYAPGELIGKPIEILIPERFHGSHVAQRDGYIAQPRPRNMGHGMELFAKRRSGEEFVVEVSLSPLTSASGPPMVMATVHDVTRRREARAALEESEARMRAIFETAVDAIITIDEKGIIDRANPAAERLFGYSEAELIGHNVSMLMPSPYRERHDGYLEHYRNTGQKKIIGIGREVAGQRKDGTTFPMDLAVAEMSFGTRRMFTGVVRDISERKQAEAALRQSQAELRQLSAYQERLKEEERKRIAQEIHDELGALLTGIKAHVSVSIDRSRRAGEQSDPLLTEALGLADTAINAVRKVITDLRPSVLDQLGVWAALEWYAEQIEDRSQLVCRCVIEPEVVDVELDQDRSTTLFRIVQEALTNVVRHAKASHADIRVAQEGGQIVATVIDDGCGIDTDRLLNRESWGILGMYERARYFGGELRIAGTPGKGTEVALRLPL
ncbi:MAG: domain S-box protein, partial [Paucimonas sp.]|nr:domain S-box protein [Paucimonas sp.]